MSSNHNDKLLSPEEVANIWCISTNTLRKWRWEGKGPQYVKLGSKVLYRQSDIDAYVNENIFSSTTQMGEAKNV